MDADAYPCRTHNGFDRNQRKPRATA